MEPASAGPVHMLHVGRMWGKFRRALKPRDADLPRWALDADLPMAMTGQGIICPTMQKGLTVAAAVLAGAVALRARGRSRVSR